MSDATHTLVGFGFGPIQAGLFVCEAAASGRFRRLVVAEVDETLVTALRATGGAFDINIARTDGLETRRIEGVELLNPARPDDRTRLAEALAEATEIVTALPSVDFFERGAPSVADLVAAGLCAQTAPARAALVYAAENHNHAAERLEAAVRRAAPAGAPRRPAAFLNTVIGKMSQVVRGRADIEALGVQPIAPGLDRAFLVESFNHILVTRHRLPGVEPGITVFDEKDDLLPFEEAKLYGHNAVHALIGFLARAAGHTMMSDAAADRDLMAVARAAFIEESGGALLARHRGLDPLFTPDGYRAYAEDLLTRMVNPHLSDSVERVTRDPLRKLGWNDRLVGVMRLALAAGLAPRRFARGAAAALARLRQEHPDRDAATLLTETWTAEGAAPDEMETIMQWLRTP